MNDQHTKSLYIFDNTGSWLMLVLVFLCSFWLSFLLMLHSQIALFKKKNKFSLSNGKCLAVCNGHWCPTVSSPNFLKFTKSESTLKRAWHRQWYAMVNDPKFSIHWSVHLSISSPLQEDCWVWRSIHSLWLRLSLCREFIVWRGRWAEIRGSPCICK